MSNYIVRLGETITDSVLNATGNIANWDAILTVNGFNDWVPILNYGDILIIPEGINIDTEVLAQLNTYPPINDSIFNLDTQIAELLGALQGVEPEVYQATLSAKQIANEPNYYTVREGETFSDAIMNSTGNISNWDAILSANGFSDWVPVLTTGQLIIIPDGLITDTNVIRQLTKYPANNTGPYDLNNQINSLSDLIANNWILKNGYWNDNGIWIDSATWNDGV